MWYSLGEYQIPIDYIILHIGIEFSLYALMVYSVKLNYTRGVCLHAVITCEGFSLLLCIYYIYWKRDSKAGFGPPPRLSSRFCSILWKFVVVVVVKRFHVSSNIELKNMLWTFKIREISWIYVTYKATN